MDRVSRDKEMLHEYLRYEMALSDERSRLEDAVEDTRMEVARNALAKGSTVEYTAEITGLPLRTMRKLQKDMGLKK
jgi:hypothetical protein